MNQLPATGRFRFRVRDALVATALVALASAWPALSFFVVPILAAGAMSRCGKGSAVPIVVAALASMATGAWISWSYWGYVLEPPQLLAELRSLVRVERISEFEDLQDDGVNASDVVPLAAIPPFTSLQTNWPAGLMPTERILADLGKRNIAVDSSTPMDADTLAAMWHAANSAGILVEGAYGYPDAKQLFGYAGLARDAAGAELLFLVAMGLEVSNDHYPYYEIAFRRRGEEIEAVNWSSYFEDIAGMEGAGFWGLWLPAALFCFVLSLLAIGVWSLVAKQRRA